MVLIISCSNQTTKIEDKQNEPPLKLDLAKSCICPKLWMPVCGENQKTYGNTCEANCAGVKFTQGPCEKTK